MSNGPGEEGERGRGQMGMMLTIVLSLGNEYIAIIVARVFFHFSVGEALKK